LIFLFGESWCILVLLKVIAGYIEM
jgi:hypothetical protein